jgi:hypothetical protein
LIFQRIVNKDISIIKKSLTEIILVKYGNILVNVEIQDDVEYRFFWTNGQDQVEMLCESWKEAKEDIIAYLQSIDNFVV